jgi:hypothetical protein
MLVWLYRPIYLLSVHFSRFDMLTPIWWIGEGWRVVSPLGLVEKMQLSIPYVKCDNSVKKKLYFVRALRD